MKVFFYFLQIVSPSKLQITFGNLLDAPITQFRPAVSLWLAM